jgi:hypothetical protein
MSGIFWNCFLSNILPKNQKQIYYKTATPVPNSQLHFKFSNLLEMINSIKLERSKMILYNWLVINITFITTKPNCGKLLRTINTKLIENINGSFNRRKYSKNLMDWIIRNRIYKYGSETIWFWGFNKSLRYSPACNENYENIQKQDKYGVVLILGPKRYLKYLIQIPICVTQSNSWKLLKFNLRKRYSNISISKDIVKMIKIYRQSATEDIVNISHAQRLNDLCAKFFISVRYSLDPLKYVERQGSIVLIAIKLNNYKNNIIINYNNIIN